MLRSFLNTKHTQTHTHAHAYAHTTLLICWRPLKLRIFCYPLPVSVPQSQQKKFTFTRHTLIIFSCPTPTEQFPVLEISHPRLEFTGGHSTPPTTPTAPPEVLTTPTAPLEVLTTPTAPLEVLTVTCHSHQGSLTMNWTVSVSLCLGDLKTARLVTTTTW